LPLLQKKQKTKCLFNNIPSKPCGLDLSRHGSQVSLASREILNIFKKFVLTVEKNVYFKKTFQESGKMAQFLRHQFRP
jgi:hypothetical protein